MGDIYRRLAGALAGKPTNFSWLISGRLAGSGRPMSRKEVKWVKSRGVGAILSLTDNPLPQEWLQGLDIKYHHLAMRNHAAPTLPQLQEAVEFIRNQNGKGMGVLVHCAAGQGRTGTVLAAYLIREQQATPEEALRRVRKARPGSVEEAQEEALRLYYEAVERG